MKKLFMLFAVVCTSTSAFASQPCSDRVIQKAAETGWKKSEQPSAGEVTYEGATRTGKDKYTVRMSVNEECMATAIVYTKAGTCQVAHVIPIGPGEGDCG